MFDGGNVIAEYDHDNFLLRKYIYGPGVDEPVCMIDVADNDAEYYYHYDGLGSAVALSDSNGDTVQTYEYSIYGQVAASDPNFLTNPYLFTGRRFDIETGLYYYRARYYNPYIGRFLQTDPIGYGDGMNWYAYCKNNPLKYVDPSGMVSSLFTPPAVVGAVADQGLSVAASIYGSATIIRYILETQGQDIVVDGQTKKILPDYDPNDPNTWGYGPQTRSFDEIMDDPNLFKQWLERHPFPNWETREYNEYEALRIAENMEKWDYGPPEMDPPTGDHKWHMHRNGRPKPNPHIPLTKKAWDLINEIVG